jgi:hypothetical protein
MKADHSLADESVQLYKRGRLDFKLTGKVFAVCLKQCAKLEVVLNNGVSNFRRDAVLIGTLSLGLPLRKVYLCADFFDCSHRKSRA